MKYACVYMYVSESPSSVHVARGGARGRGGYQLPVSVVLLLLVAPPPQSATYFS